jgi:hypothetical protein
MFWGVGLGLVEIYWWGVWGFLKVMAAPTAKSITIEILETATWTTNRKFCTTFSAEPSWFLILGLAAWAFHY